MSYPNYYSFVPKSYVERSVNDDVNQAVGYKWYQSHPSSDMDVMAASPCFSDYQPQFLQNTVSHPNLYYPEFKPPDPPPLSPYPYTPAFCAPYMFVDGSNRVETLVPNHSCYPDVPYNSQLNGREDARCVTSFDRGSLVVDQNWSDAGLGSVGEDNKVVEHVVDVRREMPVDEAVVETQLFDEFPERKTASLNEKVSGDAVIGESALGVNDDGIGAVSVLGARFDKMGTTFEELKQIDSTASTVLDESSSRESSVNSQAPSPITGDVSSSLSSTTNVSHELLSFDGTNPRGWILQVGKYVNGSDAEKIDLAGSYLSGKARAWYHLFYDTSKEEVTWKKFLHDLLKLTNS